MLNYRPRTIKPDIVALWPPTELSEGYNFEAINENYVITDNSRILRVYYVQPLAHVAGMLMAYLPAERIAFEADLFDTHEPPPAAPTPAMRSFFNQARRMKLDIATIAPVHGPAVPWSTFEKASGPLTIENAAGWRADRAVLDFEDPRGQAVGGVAGKHRHCSWSTIGPASRSLFTK